MTKHLALSLALAGTLLLAACGGQHYTHPKGERNLNVDLENCRWDAAHEQAEDGSWHQSERTAEEQDAFVRRCMKAKGYTLSSD
ncbi:hypothetical protein [Desulfobaculum sp.]|jgi:outer membrane lipopolysaccharide assembly protein LptE/RlpB